MRNASILSRFIAFNIDSIFLFFIRIFTLKLWIYLNADKIQYFFERMELHFYDKIKYMGFGFGDIIYITGQPLVKEFLSIVFLLILLGIAYNSICTIFFSQTIGQKIFKIKLVNIYENKPSVIQVITKSILFNLSFLSIFLYCGFYSLLLITKTPIFSILVFFIILFVMLLILFDTFIITENHQILCEIITKTKMISTKKNNKNNYLFDTIKGYFIKIKIFINDLF